jgi:uncharacterized protein (DUF305 family)
MRTTTRAAAALLSVAVLAPALLLAGCGSDESGDNPSESHTASNGDVFNDADARFASEMLQHHAQALSMVDLTVGRMPDMDPEMAALAEDIRSAQAPEIATLTGWLTDWDQPIPETVRDHANAHGDGHAADVDMPGMLSADQMDELEAAEGTEFRDRWLELMIEHHEGAVEMARDHVEEGEFEPAVELAASIEDSQSAEIEQMESMLD